VVNPPTTPNLINALCQYGLLTAELRGKPLDVRLTHSLP
jgi:hypothetical protein